MRLHLTPEEVIDVLDGVGTGEAVAHLHACPTCQAVVDETAGTAALMLREADVPEPAPVFWHEMGQRIRLATSELRQPTDEARRPWRPALWAPALGVLAAALVIAIVTGPAGRGRWKEDSSVPVDRQTPIAESDSPWDAVGDLASGLTEEDVRLVVGGAPDDMVYNLTAAERAAFVRLLEAEAGRSQ